MARKVGESPVLPSGPACKASLQVAEFKSKADESPMPVHLAGDSEPSVVHPWRHLGRGLEFAVLEAMCGKEEHVGIVWVLVCM